MEHRGVAGEDLLVGTGTLLPFPGIAIPSPLATNMNYGTEWEKGRKTSVCLPLPPTLRNQGGWKSISEKGTEKVSITVSDCALLAPSGLKLPWLPPSGSGVKPAPERS
jgi:hypothetical protein